MIQMKVEYCPRKISRLIKRKQLIKMIKISEYLIELSAPTVS